MNIEKQIIFNLNKAIGWNFERTPGITDYPENLKIKHVTVEPLNGIEHRYRIFVKYEYGSDDDRNGGLLEASTTIENFVNKIIIQIVYNNEILDSAFVSTTLMRHVKTTDF